MAWLNDIEFLRQVGISQMSAFSDQLSRLNITTSDLSDRCAILLSLSGASDGMDDIGLLEGDIQDIIDNLENWSARGNLPEIHGQMGKIADSLESLRKIVIKFRLVSTFAAIDTSRDDKAQIDGFLAELRAVPEQIAICLTSVNESFRKVSIVFRDAHEQAQRGLQAMRAAGTILSTQSALIAELANTTKSTISAIQSVRVDFVAETQRHANSMFTAFQFSDFFAQRMEHISHILVSGDPHHQMLAAAQINALCKDGAAVMTRINDALDGLERVAGGFQQAYSALDAETYQSQQKQTEVLQIIMHQKDDALIAIDAAQVASLRNLKEITQSQIRFGELRLLSKSIDMAAINARLRSSRLSTSQRTMAVLSTAVLESAVGCRQELAVCETGLKMIGDVHAESDAAKLSGAIKAFLARLAACKTALQQSGPRRDRLKRTQEDVTSGVDMVRSVIRGCRVARGAMAERLTDLQGLAARLPQADDSTIWPDMSEIFEIYTMEEERIVHNATIGQIQSAPPPAAVIDLADIFF